jgi:monoamine oxidase
MMRGTRRTLFRGSIPRISPLALVDLFVASRRFARGVDKLRAHAAPIAAWDAITLESWLVGHMATETGRAMLHTVARCVLAAEPSEMSFAFFVDYLRRGHSLEEVAAIGAGAQETRIVGGMQAVSGAAARGLAEGVHLDEPVLAIEQNDRSAA